MTHRSHSAALAALILFGGSGCGALVGLGDPPSVGAPDEPDAAPSGLPEGTHDAGDAGGEPSDAQPLGALAVAVGKEHACAIVQDAPGSPENGTVRCWGSNTGGALGEDPAKTTASYVPVEVAGRDTPELSGAVSLSLGADTSCATTSDKFLVCWGDLPHETTSGVHRESADPAFEPSLVDLRASPLLDVTAASIGGSGGCVVSEGAPVCWGDADFAPPGDSGLPGLDGGVVIGDVFESAAAGRDHVCAVAVGNGDPSVACWGANDHGQAGGGQGTARLARPQAIALGAAVVSVAAGGDTSCAVLTTGDVYCWGRNDRGQAGDPSLADALDPVHVAIAGSTAIPQKVALGAAHACALLSDESVWCWGDGARGQLGRGDATPAFSASPVRVLKAQSGSSALGRVKHLAAGGGTNCAVLWGDSNVWCWGANDVGQAGQRPGADVTRASSVAW